MASRAPRGGDLFTLPRQRLVGRVISTDAVVGPTHGCLLVYVHADASLSRDALLVPPLLTTRAPWSRGLFEHLRREPLLPGHALAQHAFRDARGSLFDDLGRPVSAATGPVGEYRLLEVDAIEALLAARASAGYDPPPAGPGDDLGSAVRGIVERWVASFGRPPTREEWLALYDVATSEPDA